MNRKPILNRSQKLEAFFPALEPIQSLNLRAALFRALTELKRDGTLDQNIFVRKSMLDDCKGPKFEELLAAFSTSVVRKVLAEDATDCSIAKQLILNDAALSCCHEMLFPLTLSYRIGLKRRLQEKSEREQRYHRLGRLLDVKKNELAQRTQSLDDASKVRNNKSIPRRTIDKLERHVDSNWSGDMDWVKILIRSDRHEPTNGLLERHFGNVWSHVSDDTVHKIRPESKESLLQELERRVIVQNDRLQKWRNIQDNLSKSSKSRVPEIMSQAQGLAIATPVANTNRPKDVGRDLMTRRTTSTKRSAVQRVEIAVPDDYTISSFTKQSMGPQRESSVRYQSARTSPTKAVVLSEMSETEIQSSNESSLNTPSSNADDSLSFVDPLGTNKSLGKIQNKNSTKVHRVSHGVIDRKRDLEFPRKPSVESTPLESDEFLKQISMVDGNSRDVEHSSSLLDKLSLVERTRMSMALMSPQKPTVVAEKNHTATPASSIAKDLEESVQTQFPDDHPIDTLLDRTRQSMSLMSSRSQSRRLSSKTRASMVYPISQFHSPRRDQSPFRAAEHSIVEEVLPDLDVDYETVFKSRPKIRLSPKLRPVPDVVSGSGEPACMEEPLNSEDDFA